MRFHLRDCFLFVATISLAILAGCSDSDKGKSTPPPSASSPSAPVSAVPVGAVTSSSDLSQELSASNLFAADASPPWHSQNPAKFPEWVRIAYNEPVIIRRLRMQSQPTDPTGNPQLGRAPKDFIIQASQDGQQWADLHKVQGAKFSGAWEWQEWSFDNKTAYKYYRLYITATNGDPALVSINRLQFAGG